MHFSLVLVGLLFIFSPDISLLDLLPDFVGWLLIIMGISRLADIEMRTEDAKALSRRMVLITLVKLVLSLFTFRFSSADLLLASFSYAIVEIITVIPLVSNLFTGLDYCAMRVGSPLDSNKLNTAKWYLYVFFVLKNVFAVIPATVSLFDSRMTGDFSTNTWFINFDAALRVLMVFCFFLSCVVSVVMLVYFIPFWRDIVKNRDLNGKMVENRRESVLEVPSRMLKKNTGAILSVLSFSVVFFFDFYLDGTDILPTFIGFGGVAIAGILARKNMGLKTLPLTVTSLVGFGVSLTAFLYRFIPLMKNGFVIDYSFSDKPLTLLLSALTALFTAIVFILLFILAGGFNREYTKYKLEENTVLYMLGGGALALFDFFLYAYPQYNTTFVFPSLIFGISFSALSAYYLLKLKKQISKDNKD